MRKWLGHKAAIAPNYADPDTQTLKMDRWVLKFSRARDVYDEIISKKLYMNEPARKEIVALLTRKKLFGHTIAAFDFVSGPVEAIDHDKASIQFRTVDSPLDRIDDMTAALGRFTLKVAIAGEVRNKTVFIRKVGVYVHDSFDFNDDPWVWTQPKTWASQPLGYWDRQSGYGGTNPLKGTPLDNSSFQDYRRRTGMGGDFKVFSDMKVTPVSPDESFEADVAIEIPPLGKGADRIIREIQDKLESLGYLDAKQVDGYMGRFTEAAVRDFQRNNGLRVDGDIGGPNSLTRKKLSQPLDSLKGKRKSPEGP